MRMQSITNLEITSSTQSGKRAGKEEIYSNVARLFATQQSLKQASDNETRLAVEACHSLPECQEDIFHVEEKLEEGYLLFGSVFADMGQKLQSEQIESTIKDIEKEEGPWERPNATVKPTNMPLAGPEALLKTAVLLDFAKARLRLSNAESGGAPKLDQALPHQQCPENGNAFDLPYGLKFEKTPTAPENGLEKAVVDQIPSVAEPVKEGRSLSSNILQPDTPLLVQPSVQDHREAVVEGVATGLRAILRSSLIDSAGLTLDHATPQSLRIDLSPEELGPVNVLVTRRGKSLHITLTPTSMETHQILVEDAKRLLDHLDLSHQETQQIQLRIDLPDSIAKLRDEEFLLQSNARQEQVSINEQGYGMARRQTRDERTTWNESRQTAEMVEDPISPLHDDDAVYL